MRLLARITYGYPRLLEAGLEGGRHGNGVVPKAALVRRAVQ